MKGGGAAWGQVAMPR